MQGHADLGQGMNLKHDMCTRISQSILMVSNGYSSGITIKVPLDAYLSSKSFNIDMNRPM